MTKRSTHNVYISLLEKFWLITFLVVFLNVSVVKQYLDIANDAITELCEEEEGEEEERESEEENEEEREEREKELEVIGFHDFHETVILSVDIKKSVQNSQLILDCYIEVFTPPPDFIS